MATNDFLPFAYGGGANVLSQSAYAALTTLLSGGYQSGVANSAQMNKTWRQSSIMAAVLGQFAADYSGNNSTDDGTTATLEANIVTAIRNATKTTVTLTDTGTANAYAAANTPPLVAGTWVNNVVQQVKILNANTGASTYAPDGLTAIPIYGLGLQPLQGGELYAGGTAILMKQTITGINSGNPIAVLMECAGGAQQVSPATQSQHAAQLGQVAGVIGSARNLKMSVTAASASATMTADEIVVETALGGLRYCLASFNKTINLATTGAGGMDTGSAPVSGYVALYAIYNPTTQTAALLATNAATLQGNVYGGANMPAGYTASALVSVWATNGSSQFKIGAQRDRWVSFPTIMAFNSSTAQASAAPISIATAAPLNATSVRGSTNVTTSATALVTLNLSSDANNTGLQAFSYGISSASLGYSSNYAIDLIAAQTLYWVSTAASGTPTYQVYVSAYQF
ncbi:MAG: hypothetical protein AAFO57_00120 [Pseudomonadota bacterium]